MIYRWITDDRLRQIGVLIVACIGGADYLMWQPRGSLTAVEHAIPRWMSLGLLGALVLFLGVLGLVGELWMEIGRTKSPDGPYICRPENRWIPSYIAHYSLCAIYSAYVVGCLVEMLVHWHLWGLRYPAFVSFIAVMHWAYAQKRRHDVLP